MLEVRRLKKEDIPQMISLYPDFLKDQYGRNKYYEGDYNFKRSFESYDKIINSANKVIFVGVKDGVIAGFMAVAKNSPNFFFEFDNHAYLFDGFIKEEYRTSKLGLCLFKTCEEWAKEKNCKYITTEAYDFNKEVQVCFKSQKMEPYKISYIKKID